MPHTNISQSAGRARLLAAAALFCVATPAAAWQPLSSAERGSIEWLRAWCSSGRAEVAETSWLSTLDPASAAAEIEVRIGRPCENDWTLQTVDAEQHPRLAAWQISNDIGFEEPVFLRFDEQDRLVDVWTLWEPTPAGASATVEIPQAQITPAQTPQDPIAPELRTPLPSGAAASALALLAGVLAVVAIRRRRVASAALLLGVAGLSACAGERAVEAERVGDVATGPRQLGDLLDLRRGLWLGQPVSPEPSQLARPAVRMWLAEQAIRDGDAGAARQHLDALPPESQGIAGALLLDAVLQAGNDNPIAAQRAMLAALKAMPTVDTLLVEGGILLDLLYRTEAADQLLERASQLGSRNPDLRFHRVRDRLLRGEIDVAEELLTEAYRLRPTMRSALLSDPLRAFFLRPGNGLWSLLDPTLHRAPHVEASPAHKDQPSRLTMSRAGETLERSGDTLRVRWPKGSLWIPGGALLADATPVAADQWDREQLGRSLETMARWTTGGGATGKSPAVRRLQRVVETLALENRWTEILQFTDRLSVDDWPLELAQYRAVALERTGRNEESYQLLLQLVRVVLEEDRREPSVLFQLAESLARRGRIDVAIKLGERANRMFQSDAGYDRIQQLLLDQRLLQNAEKLATDHFLLKFPAGGEESAQQIADVLESERRRLSRWIPSDSAADKEPIEVHLLWAEDFFELYDGNVSFVGLFDGRIRLPLAGVDRFDDFVIGLLAHELAHALLDRATGGSAPKWFHEGVAQLVEPVGERFNPMPILKQQGVLLSFEVVEQVLQHLPNDFLVSTAYEEALWTLIYVEQRGGRRAVADLIARFAAGDSTAAAVETVLGQDPEQFDRTLRDWWLERAPETWRSETVDYRPVESGPRRMVIRN